MIGIIPILVATTLISSSSTETAGDWFVRPEWLPVDSPSYWTPGSDDCEWFRGWNWESASNQTVAVTQAIYAARTSAESCAALYNFFAGILDREYYAYEGQSNAWDTSAFGPLADTPETRMQFMPQAVGDAYDYGWRLRQTNSIPRRFFQYAAFTNAMDYVVRTVNDDYLSPFHPGSWSTTNGLCRLGWPNFNCAFDDPDNGVSNRCIRWWTSRVPSLYEWHEEEWPDWGDEWVEDIDDESLGVKWWRTLPNFHGMLDDYLFRAYRDGVADSIYQPNPYGIWSRASFGYVSQGGLWPWPTVPSTMHRMIEGIYECGEPRACKDRKWQTHGMRMWLNGLAANTQLLSMYDITLQDYIPYAGPVTSVTYTVERGGDVWMEPQTVWIKPGMPEHGEGLWNAVMEPGLAGDLVVSAGVQHCSIEVHDTQWEDTLFHRFDVSPSSSTIEPLSADGVEFDGEAESCPISNDLVRVHFESLLAEVRSWATRNGYPLSLSNEPHATNVWFTAKIYSDPVRDPFKYGPQVLGDARVNFEVEAYAIKNRADGSHSIAVTAHHVDRNVIDIDSFRVSLNVTNIFTLAQAYPFVYNTPPIGLGVNVSRSHRIDRAIGNIPHFDFRPGKSFWDGGLGTCSGLGAIGIETPHVRTPFLHNTYNTQLSSAADFWTALNRAWHRCDTKIKEIADGRIPGIVDDPFAPIAIGDDKFEAIRKELSNLGQDQMHINIHWGDSSFTPGFYYEDYSTFDNPYFYYLNERINMIALADAASSDWMNDWLQWQGSWVVGVGLPIHLYHATLHGWFDLWADHIDTPWDEHDAFNGKAKLVHVNKVRWDFPHVQKKKDPK